MWACTYQLYLCKYSQCLEQCWAQRKSILVNWMDETKKKEKRVIVEVFFTPKQDIRSPCLNTKDGQQFPSIDQARANVAHSASLILLLGKHSWMEECQCDSVNTLREEWGHGMYVWGSTEGGSGWAVAMFTLPATLTLTTGIISLDPHHPSLQSRKKLFAMSLGPPRENRFLSPPLGCYLSLPLGCYRPAV